MEADGDHGSVGTGSCASVVLTTRAAQALRRHKWLVDAAAWARCSRPVSTLLSSRHPSGRWRAGAAGQGRGSLSGRITDRSRRGPAVPLARPRARRCNRLAASDIGVL